MTTSYDAIVSAVQAAAEDVGDEFIAYIPIAVAMAELRLTTDLDAWGQTQIVVVSTTPVNAFVSLPQGTRVVKGIAIEHPSATYTNLLMRTNEFVRDYWPNRLDTTASVTYWARWGADQIILGGTPTSSVALEMELVLQPAALSAMNQTNWYTDFIGHALFYAVMSEMCAFMKNPSAKQLWETSYQDALSMLRNETRRTRRDDNQEPGAGTENTLEG